MEKKADLRAHLTAFGCALAMGYMWYLGVEWPVISILVWAVLTTAFRQAAELNY